MTLRRRTDRILENRVVKSFCDNARRVSKGDICIERKYGDCWLVTDYGLVCPEVSKEAQNQRSEAEH